MASQVIAEGEVLLASEQDDPDLNQAFWEFTDSIKAESNAGGSIAVFEVPMDASGMARPKSFNKAKLFTVPVGACTFDDICDRVMRDFMEPGQKMMVQILGRKDGQRGLILNRLVTLKRGKEANAASGGTSEMAQMMRMMQEQRTRDRAELMELLSRNQSSVDPMQQALVITSKLTEMAVAMRTGQPVGGAVSVTDPNAMMTQMMGMMMSKMFKKMLDGEDKPAASENTSWLKDIVDLAKPLLEAKAASEKTAAIRETRMLKHEQTSQAAVPVASVSAGAPVPAGAESNADASKPIEPSPQEQNDMKLLAVLQTGLPDIITHGPEKKSDPVMLAKLVMDGLPEDDAGLNDAFYQLIQSPAEEFLAKLAIVDARAREHAVWFESFRVALLGEFEPDERVPQVQP